MPRAAAGRFFPAGPGGKQRDAGRKTAGRVELNIGYLPLPEGSRKTNRENMQMLTMDGLRAWGARVDEGLARCMGREDFYLKLVRMTCNDGNMAKLQVSVAAGDLDAAFEAAHALKGILANLALTPALTPVSEITEYLRAGKEMDYTPCLNRVTEEMDRLMALINS